MVYKAFGHSRSHSPQRGNSVSRNRRTSSTLQSKVKASWSFIGSNERHKHMKYSGHIKEAYQSVLIWFLSGGYFQVNVLSIRGLIMHQITVTCSGVHFGVHSLPQASTELWDTANSQVTVMTDESPQLGAALTQTAFISNLPPPSVNLAAKGTLQIHLYISFRSNLIYHPVYAYMLRVVSPPFCFVMFLPP